MNLHAGSLYQKYLVLYGEEETPRIITVTDRELQGKIYCNDVEVKKESTETLAVEFEGELYIFPCVKSDDPMKTLGFSKTTYRRIK